MSRVFAIVVALCAILFVAIAHPQEPSHEISAEEENTSGGLTNPCADFEAQCVIGGGQLAPVQGGFGALPGIAEAMPFETSSSEHCDALSTACAEQGDAVSIPLPVKKTGYGLNSMEHWQPDEKSN